MAANVVEVVVTAKNMTGPGFAEAKAGADEVAEAADASAAASDRAAEAVTDLEAKSARLAEVQGDEKASAEELAEAQDAYSAALDRASQATIAAIDAQEKLAAAEARAAEGSEAQGAAADESAASNDAAAASAEGMGGKIKLAALGVAVGMGLAVKSAMDFQQQTTKLVTSAGESASQLGMLQQGILKISATTATSSEQLSSGLYMISSAGITGAGGLSVLKAAAEGAKSEGADLAEVTNALTSGINAYGMKTKTSAEATVSATSMMNQMLATVSAGKMTFQELASSLSAVLPIAAANKISYAQVGGALATMTSMGISARQGTQDLAATINHLANVQGPANTEMSAFGISAVNVESNLGKRGLTGTIEMLSDAVTSKMGKSGLVIVNAMNQSKSAAADANQMLGMLPASIQGIASAYLNGTASYSTWYAATKTLPLQARTMADQFAAVAGKAHGFNTLLSSGAPEAQTYAAAMSKMLGGATGLNVGLMLTGSHAATFAKNVKSISDASNGASGQVSGFSDVTKTTAFQMAKAKDSIEAAGTSLGLALLPAVNALLAPLSSFLALIAGNKDLAIGFAVVVGGLLAGAIGTKAVHALTDMKEAMKQVADGAEWLIGKITGLGAAQETQTAATEAETEATEASDAAMDASPIGLIIIAIVALIAVIYELVKHWHTVEAVTKEVFKAVKDVVMDVFDWVKGHWPLLLMILAGPIGIAVAIILALFPKLYKGAQHVFGDIVTFMKELPGRILAALGDLGSLLFQSGKNIISGLIHGVTSMIGDVGHAVSSVVDEVKNFLPFSPAKKGPLSGGGAPDNSGRSIGRMLAQGLLQSTPMVTAAAQRLAMSAGLSGRSLGPGGGYAAYAAGGSGGQFEMTMRFEPSGNKVIDAFMESIRIEVRDKGGGGVNSVQRTFGRRWAPG